jgi:Leucine-rich repeat (LRR) protein
MNSLVRTAKELYWRLNSSDLISAKDAILFEGVQDLVLARCFGYVDFDLSCLLKLPKFSGLSIHSDCDLDASGLAFLPHLTSLSLGDALTKGCDLGVLQRLRELSITLSKNQQLPTVQMPSVRALSVWSLKKKDLRVLEYFPNLEELTIIESRQLTKLDGLECCCKLLKLNIAYCPRLENIDTLQELPQLVELECTNLKKILDISPVYGLNGLQRLILDKVTGVNDLSQIPRLTSVQHLALVNIDLLDGNLLPILDMPSLEYCHVAPSRGNLQPSPQEISSRVKSGKRGVAR